MNCGTTTQLNPEGECLSRLCSDTASVGVRTWLQGRIGRTKALSLAPANHPTATVLAVINVSLTTTSKPRGQPTKPRKLVQSNLSYRPICILCRESTNRCVSPGNAHSFSTTKTKRCILKFSRVALRGPPPGLTRSEGVYRGTSLISNSPPP